MAAGVGPNHGVSHGKERQVHWITRRLGGVRGATPRPRLTVTLLTALAVTLPGAATAQSAATAADRIRADVRYLADDAREGRGVGTVGLDSAAAYLARRFRAAGLAPGGTDGYYQTFRLDPSAPAVAHAGITVDGPIRNVVGVLPGRGGLAREAVVIGAHYDHLGLGGMGSLDPDSTGVVHNGADDNASGTAALMETGRILAARRAGERRTIVFVAFTAEELGLIGSEHYARQAAEAGGATYAMLNFDMVGRLGADSLVAIGAGSAAEWRVLVDSVNARHGLPVSFLSDPWGRSDHSSFYARQIPVLHFFTNTHTDYHRTTDDWDKIDAVGAARVAALAADLAWTLATRRDRLTFVDVPRPAPVAGGGYGAYLGTIPDMSESPGGVRLTGVRAGSPADSAGIRGGDVLVELGRFAVKNLYDMTEALRSYSPGEVVTVVVLRDGERLELTATLGRRGG